MELLRPRARWIAVPALGLLLVGGAPEDAARSAQPPPSPRFAPPAAGVLFSDDFSDGLGKWQSDHPSVWTIRRGMLRAELPDEKQMRSLTYAGSESWTDVALDLDVCMMRGVDKGAVVRVEGDQGIGVDLRGPGYQDVVMYRREWPLGKASVPNANSVWHHLRIEARGHRYTVYVNGEQKLDREDGRRARPQGRIALPAYTGGVGQCTVYYDNVIVTALR